MKYQRRCPSIVATPRRDNAAIITQVCGLKACRCVWSTRHSSCSLVILLIHLPLSKSGEVVPNQDKKATIINYKEKTVQEIMSVAASVPSGHALKLLHRAESFIRPLLPDRSAQAKLVKLLQLKASLPAMSRGTAVKELLDMLSNQPGDSTVRDLLSNFEAWDVGRISHPAAWRPSPASYL